LIAGTHVFSTLYLYLTPDVFEGVPNWRSTVIVAPLVLMAAVFLFLWAMPKWSLPARSVAGRTLLLETLVLGRGVSLRVEGETDETANRRPTQRHRCRHEAGAGFRSLKDTWANTTSPDGRLMLTRRELAWPAEGAIEPRVLPEPERDWKRIDGELAPPRGLVTVAMKLAVVDPTNRDGELVADSVSKGTRLHKCEMMRIRRRPAAYKARLPGHELPVLLIAQANRFAQGADCALVRWLTGDVRSFPAIARIGPTGGHHVWDGDRIGWLAGVLVIVDGRESRLKFLFDNLGIIRCKRVLGGKILPCPDGRLIA